MLSAALTFSVYAQKISLFNTIQSGDFRTRTASLRGGSPPFRRPVTAEKSCFTFAKNVFIKSSSLTPKALQEVVKAFLIENLPSATGNPPHLQNNKNSLAKSRNHF